MTKLLSLPECSEISGVHIDSLRRCARRGTLLANRVGANIGPWKVRPKDLEAFIQKRNNGPNFDVFPGGGLRRKVGKKVPPVTKSELDAAVEQYLSTGGKIERLNFDENAKEFNPAFTETTVLNEIDENSLAD